MPRYRIRQEVPSGPTNRLSDESRTATARLWIWISIRIRSQKGHYQRAPDSLASFQSPSPDKDGHARRLRRGHTPSSNSCAQQFARWSVDSLPGRVPPDPPQHLRRKRPDPRGPLCRAAARAICCRPCLPIFHVETGLAPSKSAKTKFAEPRQAASLLEVVAREIVPGLLMQFFPPQHWQSTL